MNNNFFLFGPRQTGKSTLIKTFFPSKKSLYYDLLRSDVYRRLAANPEILRAEVQAAYSSSQPLYVIIDEVQRVPQLLNEVHLLIESSLSLNFILSGSSSRKLKRSHANMLAGRAWTFRLHPFTYSEIKDSFDLNKVLRFGTLPKVHLAHNDYEKSEILRSYVDVYIKEEVELEANIRNLGGFLRFLPIAAAQNGEITNYTNIARESGVSYHTVREYYKILEDTLLGFFHLPYGRSIRKKLVKHPKFYFFDTGVVSALIKKLNVPYLESSYEFGRAFEHLFICELIRINEYKRLDMNFSFYRTERGAEVDCIVETPKGKLIAVEIKSTRNPVSSHCGGLYSFKQKVPDAELILACRAPHSLQINRVLAMPWEKALQYITGV
jgi:predicted AAA+ superfamily ATPase